MLLHLGKDSVIPLKEVIAIIDKESAFKSESTKKFFENAHEQGIIENVTDEVKTYILTDKMIYKKNALKKTRKSVIYTSNISSNTLKKRAGFVDGITSI